MAKRVLPVYIDDDQRSALRALSESTSESMAKLVRRAIAMLIDNPERPANDTAPPPVPRQRAANDVAPPPPAATAEPDEYTQANRNTPKVPW